MSTGLVCTEPSPASVVASPVTVATAGVIVVLATSNPSPGVPVTIAMTGTDFVVTGDTTGIRTLTLVGLSSTGVRI